MARTSTRSPAPAKRVPRKAPTKKAPAAKAPAKRTTAKATKAPAKKATVKAPVKKAPAKKTVARKAAAPAKKTAERPRRATRATPEVPPTNQRLNALEQRVDALEGERPGRKPIPLLAFKQRDVCGIDPGSDSAVCPYASIYRYQSGCWGTLCRLKQHEAYERRKPPAKVTAKAVKAPTKRPSKTARRVLDAPPKESAPPPVAKRRIVKKVQKASAA